MGGSSAEGTGIASQTTAHHTLAFAPLEHLHQKAGPFYSGTCTSLMLDALCATCHAKRFEKGVLLKGELLANLEGVVPREFGHAQE